MVMAWATRASMLAAGACQSLNQKWLECVIRQFCVSRVQAMFTIAVKRELCSFTNKTRHLHGQLAWTCTCLTKIMTPQFLATPRKAPVRHMSAELEIQHLDYAYGRDFVYFQGLEACLQRNPKFVHGRLSVRPVARHRLMSSVLAHVLQS